MSEVTKTMQEKSLAIFAERMLCAMAAFSMQMKQSCDSFTYIRMKPREPQNFSLT